MSDTQEISERKKSLTARSSPPYPVHSEPILII